MSALLHFLDTDGATEITSLPLGSVDSPGSVERKLYVENIGDQDAQNASVQLVAVGTNDGITWALIAPDVSGAPGAYDVVPVALGTLGVLGRAAFWAKVIVPTGRNATGNPRRYSIEADGFSL